MKRTSKSGTLGNRNRCQRPEGGPRDDFFTNGPRASEDFMAERNQPVLRVSQPANRGSAVDSVER
jgi:virulence-associated protein VagC